MDSMLIQTEPTPNPATLKFLPGQTVMTRGTRDFATPEEAEASPLAEAIFSTGDVEGVFFGRDFISVTAGPGRRVARSEAAGAERPARPFLQRRALVQGRQRRRDFRAARRCDRDDDPADADIVAQIKELIETRVRPAVANDGGDIVYRGFQKGTVYLALHGACSGCPSSTMTLKQGIESLLKHYVPEVETVEAV